MPTSPPVHKPKGADTKQEQRRRYDQSRDKSKPSRQWYKSAQWAGKAGRRALQLASQPLCENCLKHGRITKATVADHITPHNEDYALFWYGPLQSLCDAKPWRCHSSIKQREEAAQRRALSTQ